MDGWKKKFNGAFIKHFSRIRMMGKSVITGKVA